MSVQEKSQREIYEDAVNLVEQQLIAQHAFGAIAGQMNTQLANVITTVATSFKFQLKEIEKRINEGQASIFLPNSAAVVSFENWAQMQESKPAYVVTDNSLKPQFSLCVLAMLNYARSNYMAARQQGDKATMGSLAVTAEFSKALLDNLKLDSGQKLAKAVTPVTYPQGRYNCH
jgi:hypothetical protein